MEIQFIPPGEEDDGSPLGLGISDEPIGLSDDAGGDGDSNASTDAGIPNAPTGELACQVCGEPLTYAGRGAKPKYCDIHKGRKSSNGNISPDRNAGPRSRGFNGEAQLRTALTARYQTLSMFVAMVNPIYADAIRKNIIEAVEADIEYARSNATFRRMLEGGVEKSAAAGVIAAHGKMLLPIIVGEKVKAMRAGAGAAAKNGGNNVFRPSFGKPPAPTPSPTPEPPRDPSEEFLSRETINAAAMPGMPGF
jgi:hypothetical protein